jgi:hypothetical protein
VRAGVAGLLRDKTRSSRIPPVPASVHERTVALTLADPPGEAAHWTADMMSKAARISVSSVQRIWQAHGLQAPRHHGHQRHTAPDARLVGIRARWRHTIYVSGVNLTFLISEQ